ncbi:YggS family pyridoxal phosphate-dependent enzyme [Chitinibacteraceae bacterium HSL-7]
MATTIEAWQGVMDRIGAASAQCGRAPENVALLAVSKTFPASAIRTLYDAGQRAFGENYPQEFAGKADELSDLTHIEWHFIGPLQSNKSRLVAERAHWVHSVDRFKIAERLAAQRPAALGPLNVCIQVNVSGEASKSGVAPEDVAALAHAMSHLPQLTLRGLMCIPEAAANDAELARQFGILCNIQQQLTEAGHDLDTLSMGMSADLEVAIRCGATIVRVGSAIFGARTHRETQ